MAKGQMRSNKEARKPKKDKKAAAVPAAPLLGAKSPTPGGKPKAK